MNSIESFSFIMIEHVTILLGEVSEIQEHLSCIVASLIE